MDTKKTKGAAGFGAKLYGAFRASGDTQLSLMQRIGNRKNAVDTAKRAIEEIDELRERAFAEAERKAGKDRDMLARLKGPVYQWHVRARAILAVIAAGTWKRVLDATSYAELYARCAAIARPARKRRRGAAGLTRRRVLATERVIAQADEVQVVEILTALTRRLETLGTTWGASLARTVRSDLRKHAPAKVKGKADELTQQNLPILVELKKAA